MLQSVPTVWPYSRTTSLFVEKPPKVGLWQYQLQQKRDGKYPYVNKTLRFSLCMTSLQSHHTSRSNLRPSNALQHSSSTTRLKSTLPSSVGSLGDASENQPADHVALRTEREARADAVRPGEGLEIDGGRAEFPCRNGPAHAFLDSLPWRARVWRRWVRTVWAKM